MEKEYELCVVRIMNVFFNFILFTFKFSEHVEMKHLESKKENGAVNV